MDIAGKVFLITGAGRGLGRRLATEIAPRGAKLVLLSRTASDLDATLAQVRAAGGDAIAVPADIVDETQVRGAFQQALEAYGPVDVLVNNAAHLGPHGPLEEIQTKDWIETYQVNVAGAFHCIRSAMEHMVPRRSGAIVNISSVGGVVGFLPTLPYSCSKAALNFLSVMLARQLDRHAITVNALAVARLEPREASTTAPPRYSEPPDPDNPLRTLWEGLGVMPRAGDVVRTSDIAETILFLASPAGRSITGQVITLYSSLPHPEPD